MLTLYHAPTTRSFRIRWLLKELGIAYHEQTLDFYGYDRHQSDYRAINPIGSVPTMTDGDLVLTESGAMINHILRTYGAGRFQSDAGSQARVDEWMFWSEGLFAVHQRIYWDHCAPPPGCILDPVPEVGKEARSQALRYARMLEQHLKSEGYVVGDNLTGADFMLSFPLFLAHLEGWFEDMPRIASYIERMTSRPAFQEAIADTLEYLARIQRGEIEIRSFRATEP